MHSLFQSSRPLVMGILNVTPDSFSDGGKFNRFDFALRQAEYMVEQGVDIIDIGGESTRPGAQSVNEQDELERVIPLIEAVVQLGKPVSIDTSKAAVMKAAVAAGAQMINDVCALQQPGAIEAAAELQVPVCLMHMQGQPRNMQKSPSYQNVVLEVLAFLAQRVQVCEQAGITRDLIAIDPGFGFGKTLNHNIELMKGLHNFKLLQLPVLVGVSRKSMLGQLTGRDVEHRLAASLSAALIAVSKQANIIRVHDVAETVDALKIFNAIN